MAPKKADLAGKKAEAVQELSSSALELALPLWNDAAVLQDFSPAGGRPACFLRSSNLFLGLTLIILCVRCILAKDAYTNFR